MEWPTTLLFMLARIYEKRAEAALRRSRRALEQHAEFARRSAEIFQDLSIRAEGR